MNKDTVVSRLVFLAVFCSIAMQSSTCIASTCPTGTSFNQTTGKCESAPACPSGTTFNAGNDRCEAAFAACLAGYSYNPAKNACEVSTVLTTQSASCPSGSSFNPSLGKCEAGNLTPCQTGYTFNANNNTCEIAAVFIPASSCPAGYSYDGATNTCLGAPASACVAGGSWWKDGYAEGCYSNAQLPQFTWDDEISVYWGPVICPPAYTLNHSNGSCSGPMVVPSCPDGSVYGASSSKCEAPAAPACAPGYTYNAQTTKCQIAPVVSTAASICRPGYVLNVDTNTCVGYAASACVAGGSWWKDGFAEGCYSNTELPQFTWDDETGVYWGPVACPTGYALDHRNGSCSGSPCQSGTIWNVATSACEVPVTTTASTAICLSGSSFNPSVGKCVTNNLSPCQTGYSYNVNIDKCEIAATFVPASGCPTGYTYDAATNTCQGAPASACVAGGSWWKDGYAEGCYSNTALPQFTWDNEIGVYWGPVVCPPAFTLNHSNGSCSGQMVVPSCPDNSVYGASSGKCEAPAGPVCASGYTYNAQTTKCQAAPMISPVQSTCVPGYVLTVDTNICAGYAGAACVVGGSWWKDGYAEGCYSSTALPQCGWDGEIGVYWCPVVCPMGYALDHNTGSCSAPACQSGYAYDPAASGCIASGCPIEAVKENSLCVAPFTCLPDTTYNPVTDKCEAGLL